MTYPAAKFSELHVGEARARWAVGFYRYGGYVLGITNDDGDYGEIHLSDEEFYELREKIDDLYWETRPSTRQEQSTD